MNLPEGRQGAALFCLWGPSKNFQHLEAIATDLKRALALNILICLTLTIVWAASWYISDFSIIRARCLNRTTPFNPRRL